MARTRPAERYGQLISTATRVFIVSGGFRRTQIGDVAKALGVAKGTVYLYVESKEALFDVVMRHALGLEGQPDELPIPTPSPDATVALVAEHIRDGARFPSLDADADLPDVLGELYDVLERNRTAIKLIGTSAHDMPELAAIWFDDGRKQLNRRLAAYLRARLEGGRLAEAPDPDVAARMITETLTWFAVHRHWDPAPQAMDADAARSTAIGVLVRGLEGARR